MLTQPSVCRSLRMASAALLGACLLHAAPQAEFELAFKLFAQASAGEEATIANATESFEVLLKAEPANPVLMPCAGAVTTMRTTITVLP